MATDKCRWVEGVRWTDIDRCRTKVNECRMDLKQTSNKIAMDVLQNYDGREMKL
jgi:hypothetical protein